MSYGTAHGVQIVVFNSQLMNLGAVMSIMSNDADVAEQVLKALYDVTDNGFICWSANDAVDDTASRD